MEQPGHEANVPWGDEGKVSPSSMPNAPQPIVLGGAAGLSLNTEVQNQMSSQLTPTGGTTLSGSVGTIDSNVWTPQVQGPSQGSMLKGIGITCLFGILMTLIPVIMMGYADNSWDSWEDESLKIDWDEEGLNGTFQLSEGDISECDIQIYDDAIEWGDPNHMEVYGDCNGDLVMWQEVTKVQFTMLNDSWGEFTFFPDYYHGVNDSINITLLDIENGSLDTQSFDENMTPLQFQVNVTNWERCNQEIMIEEDNRPYEFNQDTHYYPEYWSQSPSCSMQYVDFQDIIVGSIDYESGFGEFFLNEKLDDSIVLRAEYYVYYDDFNIGELLYSCIAPLFSFACFVFWIVQIVRAFQGGKTKQGTGMLIGIIPAFFGIIFLTFVTALMLFGF